MRPAAGLECFQTVNAGDFLNQVFLDFNVETIRWRRNGEVFAVLDKRQTQTRENVGDLLC